MSWEGRAVDNCQWRHMRSDAHAADCGLLQKLLGLDQLSDCEVPAGACEACVASFPPSPEDPNPVVASLLFELASDVMVSGGKPGCSVQQARDVRDSAISHLPLMTPDEIEVTASNRGILPAPELPSIASIVPAPQDRCGRRVGTWAVGVTTAPRRLPTLRYCLDSLKRCGWENPHLFADNRADVPEEYGHLECTSRNSTVGAFPNFHLALLELYHRNPEADAFLMVQDDVVLYEHPGLRAYLEDVLWPGTREGIASLFTSQVYAREDVGWSEFEGQWLWGAQAFIFSNSVAVELLTGEHLARHRTESHNGLALIDHCIGKWAVEQNVPVMFPTPSLAQHIGHTSTLWRKSRLVGGRRAGPFAGDARAAE